MQLAKKNTLVFVWGFFLLSHSSRSLPARHPKMQSAVVVEGECTLISSPSYEVSIKAY